MKVISAKTKLLQLRFMMGSSIIVTALLLYHAACYAYLLDRLDATICLIGAGVYATTALLAWSQLRMLKFAVQMIQDRVEELLQEDSKDTPS